MLASQVWRYWRGVQSNGCSPAANGASLVGHPLHPLYLGAELLLFSADALTTVRDNPLIVASTTRLSVFILIINITPNTTLGYVYRLNSSFECKVDSTTASARHACTTHPGNRDLRNNTDLQCKYEVPE